MPLNPPVYDAHAWRWTMALMSTASIRHQRYALSQPAVVQQPVLPALLRAAPRPIAEDQDRSAVHALLPRSDHQPPNLATQFALANGSTRHLNGCARCALTSPPHAGSPLMKEASSC